MTAESVQPEGSALRDHLSYNTYREAGGFLSEGDYSETMEYLYKLRGDPGFMASELQAAPRSDRTEYRQCSGSLGSRATEIGEALFCYIHRYRTEDQGLSGVAVISKTGDKSDQAVTAETLLLSGRFGEYEAVITGYPHLFGVPPAERLETLQVLSLGKGPVR